MTLWHSPPAASQIHWLTLSLSRELGFDVIAEGVEQPPQARLLGEVGCTRAQGCLYGRPVPLHLLGPCPTPGPAPGRQGSCENAAAGHRAAAGE
jgi:EAL domain-containing protein (putative c-di-GMP-specific phosphodiesterase class I)